MPSKMPSRHFWLYREYAGNVLELLMTQIMYYLKKMLPFHPGLTCLASKGIICAPSFESCRQAADRKEEYIEDETHKDNCACHDTNLAEADEVSETQTVNRIGSGGTIIPENIKSSGRSNVLVPEPSICSPVKGLDVTAMGFVDGKLHIQMATAEKQTLDNHGYFYHGDSAADDVLLVGENNDTNALFGHQTRNLAVVVRDGVTGKFADFLLPEDFGVMLPRFKIDEDYRQKHRG